MKIVFFLLLLIFVGAQNSDIVNYSTKNGMTSNTCYLLSQDEKEKIWIGSDNGLNSFDGKSFDVFNEKNGLTNLEIISSYSLGNGQIFLLDLTKKGFILQYHRLYPLSGQLDFDAICLSYEKEIYLFNNHKLKVLDPLNNYKESRETLLRYDYICRSYGDKIVYSLGQKLFLYELKKRQSYPLEIKEIDKFEKLNYLWFINQKFYYFNEKGISIFEVKSNDLKKIKFFPTSEVDPENTRAKIDKNGNIWAMKSEGGLSFATIDLKNNNPLKFKKVANFNQQMVNDVLVDLNNNVWVTTRNNGLYFIQNTRFEQVLTYPYPFIDNDVKNIAYFDKSTYFSVGSELYSLDSNKKLNEVPIIGNTENLRIIKTLNDKLFILTNRKLRYLKYKTIHNIELQPFSYKNISTFNNDYILLTSKGAYLLDLEKQTTKELFNKRSYSCLQYTKDSVFIGTPYGLYKLDVRSKKSKAFLPHILQSYMISDIVELKKGLYICSTNAAGLFVFDDEKIIKHFTSENGLSSNNVKSLKMFNASLYAVTFDGLNRIPLQNLGNEIYKFNMRDGLPSNNINAVVANKDSILVATDAGLFISKNQPHRNQFLAKVSIDHITINDTVYYDLKNLPPIFSNSILSFKLIYPDYSSLGDIQFKYQLKNYDKEWTTSSINELIYKNIPPGNYELLVIGINSKNEETPFLFRYPIKIKYRFYEYLGVQILAAILALMLIIWYVYYITKRNSNRRTKNEKQMAQLELKAIKAQLNPHFISNCLNSISFLIHKGELQTANKYIDIFSKMIRLNLDYSNQNFVSIQKEIAHLNYYVQMEQLRFEDFFSFHIKFPSESCESQNIPTFFIQPFVENAIKHAFKNMEAGGKIEVQFNCIGSHQIEIVIMDNGMGFKPKEDFNKENSYGISLILNRIDNFNRLHKSKIHYSYGNGYNKEMKGAYFILNIRNHE